MTQAADILDAGFEKHIENVFEGKKNEIEKVLVEIVDQEKLKAKQQIAALEQEFQKEKENLNRHKAMLEAVKSATEDIRGPIRKHIDQARHCRIMIRRMAAQIGEECRKAGELTGKIRELRRKADEETARLLATLADRYGTAIQIAESLETDNINADLEQELRRLNEYRERLSAEDGEPTGAGESAMEIGTGCEDDLQVPENSGPSETAVPLPATSPEGTSGGTDPDAISGILEAYRRTESVPNGGEFHYYQKDAAIVLDGESLLAPTTRLIEAAKNLHARLAETKSSKGQFFLKREILDQQELLRKVVLRAVKLCEKEAGSLPHHTSDIINVQTLKDILEKLNMGNWSDPYGMKSFEDEISALKALLSARTSDRLVYQKSLLDQLNQN
ncbi:hypothetical protein D4R89_12030 [bacterium]|nr:MAG: hypothetical protein D4R89_12030 [bacterium]